MFSFKIENVFFKTSLPLYSSRPTFNKAILGLESPLVKSHGATDTVGFAHSINVCNQIVKANLIEKIKSNLITIDDKF